MSKDRRSGIHTVTLEQIDPRIWLRCTYIAGIGFFCLLTRFLDFGIFRVGPRVKDNRWIAKLENVTLFH